MPRASRSLAVDIETDPEAVEPSSIEANGGNAIVPTVRFPDGSTLTNPTIAQVRAQALPPADTSGRQPVATGPVWRNGVTFAWLSGGSGPPNQRSINQRAIEIAPGINTSPPPWPCLEQLRAVEPAGVPVISATSMRNRRIEGVGPEAEHQRTRERPGLTASLVA